MIKLSVRELARYMRSNSAQQHTLLQAHRYRPPESTGRARFYTEARTVIAAYHRGDVSLEQVETRIAMLRAQAKGADRFAKAQLTSNAEVLMHYIAHQGHRRLTLAGTPVFEIVRSQVRITAKPTLFATEHDVRCLIFLEFGVAGDKEFMGVMAQLAYEIAVQTLTQLPLRAVQVIDVRTGYVADFSRRRFELAAEIAAACKTIATRWPTIQPPPGWNEGTAATRQLSMEWNPEP